MTEEQIIQNSEEYFNNDFAKRLPSEVRSEELIKEAYIIGAHSRDEEVADLKKFNYKIHQQYDEKVIENSVLSDRIDELEFQLKKCNKEYILMKSAYKVLEDKLNKLDPEWNK